MELSMPAEVEAYRETVKSFLERQLPPDWAGQAALDEHDRERFAVWWRQVLAENGMLAASWPERYGGAGLSLLAQSVLSEEFTRAGVPLVPQISDLQGLLLIGPTILEWGSEAQRAEFLPKVLSGQHRWAQGFSEPEAGSDLAGLATSARREGDWWVLNGQKVWQTAGDVANWIYVLARTDPSAAKHRGLSLLLVPVDQPGVEVRPIRTMTGDAEFCEVFFTDACTRIDNVVGGIDNGWKVAMSLLGIERGASASAAAVASRIELDRLAELGQNKGKANDPMFRQRFAWCFSKVEIMRYLGLRTLTNTSKHGTPGAESSILKLYGSEYHKKLTELAMSVLGTHGTVASGRAASTVLGPDPLGGANSPAAWQQIYLATRAETIYGGSSQIQRNVIGERVLGLPRDPAAPAKVERR